MPPLYPQDPLAAVQRGAAWTWLDVPVAFAEAASEAWVLALLALALYAWLEHEVRDVMAVFLPLAAALGAAVAVTLLARTVDVVPRPVGGGRSWRSLLDLVAGAQSAPVAALVVYSLRAYGRRARLVLPFAVAFALARAFAGPRSASDLAAGVVIGAGAALLAELGARRLFPLGRLARLRGARPARGADAVARPPSA